MVHLVTEPFGYQTFCPLFRSPFGYRTISLVTEWSYGHPSWKSKPSFSVPCFARDSNRQAFFTQVIKKAKKVIKGCFLKTSLMLKNAWHNIPFYLSRIFGLSCVLSQNWKVIERLSKFQWTWKHCQTTLQCSNTKTGKQEQSFLGLQFR